MDLIEVINGNGPPPSVVLELVRYLPPGSACESIQLEAPDMLGYDIAARILLNVSDWSQATMMSAGQWGKKRPKFTPETRPWVEARKKAKQKAAEGINIFDLQSILARKAAQGR